MKIVVCGSPRFSNMLYEVREALERRNYEVLLTDQWGDKRICKSNGFDAVYVANPGFQGIDGYIDDYTLNNITQAHSEGVPIFLMKAPSEHDSKRERLFAMRPVVVGRDWDSLDRLVRARR